MAEKTIITQNICGLCDKKSSKYCCPRCDVLYCSLECYKSEKHSHCSESFYRDCVNEELATYHADDESKRKMVDILKKMQEEGIDGPENIEEILGNDENECSIDSDDEETIDLHERVKGLNLNDPESIWSVLTEDERNEFEALLNDGAVGDLIPQWEPWWLYSREEKLVQDINDEKEKAKEEEALKKCPPLISVPEFTSLTKVKPSPAIKFNISNILASYAFIAKYFNGEIEPVEATVYLLSICGNLQYNTNYEDVTIAVEAVAQKCLQSEHIEVHTASLDGMRQDFLSIINGPSDGNNSYYCKAALSHIHRILTEAVSTGKKDKSCKDKSEFSRKFPEHTRQHLPKLDASKVKKCIKKVEFYLSFIESFGMEFE